MTQFEEAVGLLREWAEVWMGNIPAVPPGSIAGRTIAFLQNKPDAVDVYCYTCNLCSTVFTGPRSGASCPKCKGTS